MCQVRLGRPLHLDLHWAGVGWVRWVDWVGLSKVRFGSVAKCCVSWVGQVGLGLVKLTGDQVGLASVRWVHWGVR